MWVCLSICVTTAVKAVLSSEAVNTDKELLSHIWRWMDAAAEDAGQGAAGKGFPLSPSCDSALQEHVVNIFLY